MDVEKIDLITGRNKKIQNLLNLIPKNIRLIFNPRIRCIENFVKNSANELKKGTKILDAGAGPCPYKKFFEHCDYESTDVVDNNQCLDFTCSLNKIPKKSSSYDAILNTEVLEHVEDPLEVLKEINRVLKKEGKLFLTVPQGWRIHQAPHNYFYFTKYGLKILLDKAGFSKIKIEPMGGYFWFLADAIRFNNLLEQIKSKKLNYYILKIIGYPFTQIFIPLLLFYLDFLDSKKDWTMGYTVKAIK